MNWTRILLSSALLMTAACGDSEGGAPGDDNGDGGLNSEFDGGTGSDGDGGTGGGERDGGGGSVEGDGGGGSENDDCDGLKAVIRDFHKTHPDFETFAGSSATTGMVKNDLGSDANPVYTGICQAGGAGPCPNGQQSSSKANFDQWYTDVPAVGSTPAVNASFNIELPLKEVAANSFEYNNSAFFPIDGKGFGNEGNDHNFHFTTEVHTSFTYVGGQKFSFTGDDDLWIFVNKKLALDLGGLHAQVSGTIDFDAQAAKLGIEKGKTYSMDIFHAERHTSASNFHITTNIECFKDPPVVI